MPWLALTLEIEAGTAELLSEALLEAGAYSVSIENPQAPTCRLSALIGADADPDTFMSAVAAHADLTDVPRYRALRVEDEDWVRRSQAEFTPIAIGERLLVTPSWHEAPAGFAHAGGAVVRLDPGLAFGTGTHQSTRLVLEFLEKSIQGGERVLDYGCGSGILGIAAAKLGAAQVAATDIDPVSVATTADNAHLNGVTLRTCAPDELEHGLYDLVVSNILAQPLILLAPLLAAQTAPGGELALLWVI